MLHNGSKPFKKKKTGTPLFTILLMTDGLQNDTNNQDRFICCTSSLNWLLYVNHAIQLVFKFASDYDNE